MEDNGEKKKPIDSEFVSLGEFEKDGVTTQYAFKWTLWDNNVVLSNLKRKKGDEKYEDYGNMNLTARKIAIIIPHMTKWFHILREKKKE